MSFYSIFVDDSSLLVCYFSSTGKRFTDVQAVKEDFLLDCTYMNLKVTQSFGKWVTIYSRHGVTS